MDASRASRIKNLNSEMPGKLDLGRLLDHAPVPLGFGTSGRRGLLKDLSQLEVYINALGEIEFLKTLPDAEGGVRSGEPFFVAADLRPSSTQILETGRGGLAQAILRAVADAGLEPVYLGAIPTPALTAYAIARGKGSMMVTGSHIPFDRNGFKTNTAIGELLKHHEDPIAAFVAKIRKRVYEEDADTSIFNASGMLKQGAGLLPEASDAAAVAYVARYVDFFEPGALSGLNVLVYQHSAVGRDLLPEILERLGAHVVRAGRSEVFVPIDTENVDQACLDGIQGLLDTEKKEGHVFDAVVSTDGDSDRPLILGVDAVTEKKRFFGGDLLGMVAAEFLEPDAVVVPISCNDAIDRGPLAPVLEPKTRIGSPFVIQGMLNAEARGALKVVGWEANGGFLTGGPIERRGRLLSALPTRDAVLPILAVLARGKEKGVALTSLFEYLPPRFSRAALLKDFPRAKSEAILSRLRLDSIASSMDSPEFRAWAQGISAYFGKAQGFGPVSGVDYTDGVRLYFVGGDIAHLRPSGNADEFRIYAVADTQARADEIVSMGVREPDGILRALERDTSV